MTKEEAIKVIESNRPSSGYTRLCEALDMAVAALKNQDWIPVSEAMPDVWKDVLTHRTGGDVSIEFRCSGGGWSFDNDIEGNVTHWMPLPELQMEELE